MVKGVGAKRKKHFGWDKWGKLIKMVRIGCCNYKIGTTLVVKNHKVAKYGTGESACASPLSVRQQFTFN